MRTDDSGPRGPEHRPRPIPSPALLADRCQESGHDAARPPPCLNWDAALRGLWVRNCGSDVTLLPTTNSPSLREAEAGAVAAPRSDSRDSARHSSSLKQLLTPCPPPLSLPRTQGTGLDRC